MAEYGIRYTRLVFGCAAGTRTAQDIAEAAEIARWLGLELSAMMIEDETIAGLSAHPGAALLSLSSAVRGGNLAETMERETRAAVTAFRRRLEREATGAKLTWSFEALRGRAETIIAGAIRQSDIFLYCEPPSSLEREAFPERNLWQAVEQSPAAMLYRPSRPLPSRSGVMTVSSGAKLGNQAVDAVARQLARAMNEPLRRIENNGDWHVLATHWGRTPPRLIVLERGSMGLVSSDAIAQAARTLRVPLLVLERATKPQ